LAQLVLVPTPIGHLDDITLRALNVLRSCDFILAEDTRETKKLLHHFEIDKSMVSYHQHNEHHLVPALVKRIAGKNQVALVTDAGTPGISDPGFLLVRECLKEHIEVTCLPGATAFVPALVISGLPCEKFVFEGFLPHKKGRETRIRAIAAESRTVVLYESTHRLTKTLEQLLVFCGPQRPVSVSRELTKKFEETYRGTLAEAIAHFSAGETRGEFVLIIGARSEDEGEPSSQ
jgi:16S rRNA (cytidine1402-2'-O)-methyltransferase